MPVARSKPDAKLKKPSPETVLAVLETLSKVHPDHRTELKHQDPFELLVAVILSAQCTDARVNQVTPALFARYPDAAALANAKPSDVETRIQSCGFYRNKTKSIIGMARALVENFQGRVPDTLEELVTLDGVGRKTASVVLNQAFDKPAIAVDTHVRRVSQRLGWSRHQDPEKIEADLRELVPVEHWSVINGLLILHGRRTCKARKPDCGHCSIERLCPYPAKCL